MVLEKFMIITIWYALEKVPVDFLVLDVIPAKRIKFKIFLKNMYVINSYFIKVLIIG
jgi:hypothetical protein